MQAASPHHQDEQRRAAASVTWTPRRLARACMAVLLLTCGAAARPPAGGELAFAVCQSPEWSASGPVSQAQQLQTVPTPDFAMYSIGSRLKRSQPPQCAPAMGTGGLRLRFRAAVALSGACFLALWMTALVAGQGLIPDTTTKISSSGSSSKMAQLLMRSRAAKAAAARVASAKRPCARSSSAIVCAAAADDNSSVDEYAALLLATSPLAWNSASPQATAGRTRQVVAPAGNQGACATCAAFAVGSAAQTAVATAMHADVSEVSISVQALYACPAAGPVRSCQAGWTFKEALTELEQRGGRLPTAQCMPYRPDPTGELGRGRVCSSLCSTSSSLLGQGRFASKQIATVWQGQCHIHAYGAVVSRFDIYSDFNAFFADKRNAKAVYRRRADAELVEPHAVVLVGYNNTDGFWIAKNSWGPDWGDGGLFRVAYGECNVLGSNSGEAYGITWTPNQMPPAAVLPVAPGPPGCYLYTAKTGDFLSRVAGMTEIQLKKLLEDNSDRISNLDAPLAGTQLLLCGPAPGSVAVTGAKQPVPGGATPAVTPVTQVATAGVEGPATDRACDINVAPAPVSGLKASRFGRGGLKLGWGAPSGGGCATGISVSVTEVSSGAFDTLPPLPATTTSATIPEGSLELTEAYTVHVTISGPRFTSETVTVPVPVEQVPVPVPVPNPIAVPNPVPNPVSNPIPVPVRADNPAPEYAPVPNLVPVPQPGCNPIRPGLVQDVGIAPVAGGGLDIDWLKPAGNPCMSQYQVVVTQPPPPSPPPTYRPVVVNRLVVQPSAEGGICKFRQPVPRARFGFSIASFGAGGIAGAISGLGVQQCG